MDYQTIKKLLNRYWEGETTLAEEQQLRTYFNRPEGYDPRFGADAPWFLYTQVAAKQQSQRPVLLAQRRPSYQILRWAVAASIALLLAWGLSRYQGAPTEVPMVAEQSMQDTYKDPQAAYEATKAALKRLSRGLNKGVKTTSQELKNMPKLDNN